MLPDSVTNEVDMPWIDPSCKLLEVRNRIVGAKFGLQSVLRTFALHSVMKGKH